MASAAAFRNKMWSGHYDDHPRHAINRVFTDNSHCTRITVISPELEYRRFERTLFSLGIIRIAWIAACDKTKHADLRRDPLRDSRRAGSYRLVPMASESISIAQMATQTHADLWAACWYEYCNAFTVLHLVGQWYYSTIVRSLVAMVCRV